MKVFVLRILMPQKQPLLEGGLDLQHAPEDMLLFG
jgi:hypothetical protein